MEIRRNGQLQKFSVHETCVDSRFIQALRMYVAEAEIKPKIKNHQECAEWQGCLRQRLQRAAMIFFFLGLLAYRIWPNAATGWPVIFRTEPGYASAVVLWVKVATVIFPAVGAMFAGIRSHGEFKWMSRRSIIISRFHEGTLALLIGGGTPGWNELVRITSVVTEEMLGEVIEWWTVVEGRNISLLV